MLALVVILGSSKTFTNRYLYRNHNGDLKNFPKVPPGICRSAHEQREEIDPEQVKPGCKQDQNLILSGLGLIGFFPLRI